MDGNKITLNLREKLLIESELRNFSPKIISKIRDLFWDKNSILESVYIDNSDFESIINQKDTLSAGNYKVLITVSNNINFNSQDEAFEKVKTIFAKLDIDKIADVDVYEVGDIQLTVFNINIKSDHY